MVLEIYAKKLLSDPYILFLVTEAMFFDESQSLVPAGQVVSEEKIFVRNNIKNSQKTSKKGNNSNMAF